MKHLRYFFYLISVGFLVLTSLWIPAASVPAHAAFPGTNGKIVFMSNRNGGSYEIFSMDSDGTNQTNLTNNTTVNDSDPEWSPDGTKIVFDSNRVGNQQIFVMNADGSGVTRLTNNSSFEENPDWSPDGSKILFE